MTRVCFVNSCKIEFLLIGAFSSRTLNILNKNYFGDLFWQIAFISFLCLPTSLYVCISFHVVFIQHVKSSRFKFKVQAKRVAERTCLFSAECHQVNPAKQFYSINLFINLKWYICKKLHSFHVTINRMNNVDITLLFLSHEPFHIN